MSKQDQMLKTLLTAVAKSGLSDAVIAKKAGVSRTIMYPWRAGRYPAIDSYCKVAAVLGVKVSARK